MDKKSGLFGAVSILGLIFAVWATWYLNKAATGSDLKVDVESFGVLAPVFFILLTSISNVIPPLAITVLWLLGIILFGPFWGFVYSYIANIVGSCINYWITRVWGRRLIFRFTGQEGLDRINKYTHVTKAKDILMLKIFSGAASDYISYAAGLARLPFRVFLWTTAVGNLPMIILGFLLLYIGLKINLFTIAFAVALFYGISYATTIFMVPMIYRLSQKAHASVDRRQNTRTSK